jgi:Ca2+-binding RTX toxin-like protein
MDSDGRVQRETRRGIAVRYYTGTAASDTVVGDPTADDTFTGFGQGRDVVTGGQGNDVFNFSVDLIPDFIDGGGGENRLDYSASDRGLTIDLSHGFVSGTFFKPETITFPPSDLGPNGTVGGTFTVMEAYQAVVAKVLNIQDVTGTDFGDTIIGTAGDNKIDGGKGDDHIFGGTGANIINGGDGNDTITLQFEGTGLAANMDTIDGGNGIDTLAFAVSAALPGTFGVDVNLSSHDVSSIHDLDGSPDGLKEIRSEATVTNVENVTGTDQNDVIIGDSNANTLLGNGGNDVLEGGAGADYLDGGPGNDRFIEFGAGHGGDEIHGGDGIDTVEYTYGGGVVLGAPDPDHAVIVTLADNGNAGTAMMFVDGPLGHPGVVEDHLYDIENVTGSDFDDTLTGNNAKNILLGGFGEDHLNGGGNDDLLNGGPGHDVLTGGAGADTFQFSDRGFGANADTITDFQTGVDHIGFSGFYSQAFQFHNFHSNDLPPPTFIADHAFSGAGNELRVVTNNNGDTIVQLQIPSQEFGLGNTSHTTPDVEINLGHHVVHQSDFLF